MNVTKRLPSVFDRVLSPTQQILNSAAEHRFSSLVRFFVYVALVVHLGFVTIFFVLNIHSLMLVNIGSVTIYMVAIWLGRNKHLDLAFLLCTVEILIHAALASLLLGWGSGFHYYISVMALFIFFHPSRRLLLKLAGAVAMFCLYVVLFAAAQRLPTMAAVSPEILSLFERLNLATFFMINVLLGYIYNKAVEDVEVQLRSVNRQLDRLARTDTLTGLLNRRSMVEILDDACHHLEITPQPFTLILGDVDNFKQINDVYGHHCGDLVLKELSQLLRLSVRVQDQIARWGGEEFLIFLPDTTRDEAMIVAERVRRGLEDHEWHCGELQMPVTMSFGVSGYRWGDSIERTVMTADRALYSGKAQGKNCVVAALD